MNRNPWKQVNVTFRNWVDAEQCAVTYLAPLLNTAEADGIITSWFFIRKAPCWRLRHLPNGDAAAVRTYIHRRFEEVKSQPSIIDIRGGIYEPEHHAFGGIQAMASAHRLFHLDSRHLLAHLANNEPPGNAGHRRELSILLYTGLLRAAGLDWYEQGDVWAGVAEHRDISTQLPVHRPNSLEADLRRLMSVDITDLMGEGASLEFAAAWAEAYAVAGRELAALAADGHLHRGLRAVLAHHIIFAWNRLGLSYTAQAVLANTAKTVVFSPDPTFPSTAMHPAERQINCGRR